jgi:hypothetical protein
MSNGTIGYGYGIALGLVAVCSKLFSLMFGMVEQHKY